MLRIFRSFEAQPRLAIVTATLKTAAPVPGRKILAAMCSLVKGENIFINIHTYISVCWARRLEEVKKVTMTYKIPLQPHVGSRWGQGALRAGGVDPLMSGGPHGLLLAGTV